MWNGGLALAQEDLRHNIGSGPKGVRLQMKTVLHLVFRLAVPHKELRCKRGAAADGSAVISQQAHPMETRPEIWIHTLSDELRVVTDDVAAEPATT